MYVNPCQLQRAHGHPITALRELSSSPCTFPPQFPHVLGLLLALGGREDSTFNKDEIFLCYIVLAFYILSWDCFLTKRNFRAFKFLGPIQVLFKSMEKSTVMNRLKGKIKIKMKLLACLYPRSSALSMHQLTQLSIIYLLCALH